MSTVEAVKAEALSDEEIVARVLAGETNLYELIMRRYNQRLYRITRAILRDGAEAEDVMQDAYVRAYEHLNQFAGRAKFSTWLTRIAVHEALARMNKRRRMQSLDTSAEQGALDHGVTDSPLWTSDSLPSNSLTPEEEISNMQTRALLEQAIFEIPEAYRVVFTMREVEQLSTADTATILGLSEENVKVRLHRGRSMLRRALYAKLGEHAPAAFPFMGEACDRVVAAVLERVAQTTIAPSPAGNA